MVRKPFYLLAVLGMVAVTTKSITAQSLRKKDSDYLVVNDHAKS